MGNNHSTTFILQKNNGWNPLGKPIKVVKSPEVNDNYDTSVPVMVALIGNISVHIIQ